jgi:hypothetical protein
MYAYILYRLFLERTFFRKFRFAKYVGGCALRKLVKVKVPLTGPKAQRGVEV